MRAGGTRRLVALFVAGTLLPSGALVWLGARLIEQDRQLERQRVQDFVESAANRVTGSLERQLGTIERNLGSAAADDPATPPAGLKVRIFVDGHAEVLQGLPLAYDLALRDQEVEVVPPGRVAFVPMPRPLPEPQDRCPA